MLTLSTVAFTCKLENGQFSVYKLGEYVQTFFAASNSVILSLAAFITWKFPLLPHPNYLDYEIEQCHHIQPFPSPNLSLHPLFEAWCDLLCKSVFEGMGHRFNNTLYIQVQVSSDYIKYLQKLNLEHKAFQKQLKINQIFNLPKTQKKQKKIVLMNLASSQLRQDQFLPKINIPALLLGTLYDNENWYFYCGLKGQIPLKQDLITADTIILPGSSYSVLDFNPHIDLLVSQLKESYKQNIKLKILSICFGHQLVSKIHGAMITRKNRFEGHEAVSFNKNLTQKYSFLEKITNHIAEQFIMPQHHQDYVESVPQNFDMIATSKSCLVQAMVKQDGRIFSLQFHPQYFTEYTAAFTARCKMAQIHTHHLSFDLAIEEQRLNAHHQSCVFVRQCIKQFIASTPKIIQQ